MIAWILATVIFVVAIVIYTMIVNRRFLRCPHCRKIGAWRFDTIGEPIEERDDDGVVIRSTTPMRCRKCGGEVVDTWSDFGGQEIRIPTHSTETSSSQETP